MKILYQANVNTIYAGRTIYHGYKHAFEDLGFTFKPFNTGQEQLEKVLKDYRPDIFITGLNNYTLKYVDLELLTKYRKKNLKVFVNIPFWRSPFSRTRINESSGLKDNEQFVFLIKQNKFGDVYFNSCEQDDARMDGFAKDTGRKYHTIPLAADKNLINSGSRDSRFTADLSYVGTYLPTKRVFFNNIIFPLKKFYTLKLYGQDWTLADRSLGWLQRFGQYFNIPFLRSVQKPKLELEDEAKIYASSKICINIHEDYQQKFGGDCNERTFKIPLFGGFEITDNVSCIKKYFKEGEEIIIAENKNDWFEKIRYYIDNPEKRLPIIEAGQKKVLAEHTYHNRVEQMVKIFEEL